MRIETNVGSTMMLKDMRHVPDLRMNVFFTWAMDRAGYCNYLGNGRWKLTEGTLVVARGHACCGLYRTHVKTCKKKSNEIKDWRKPHFCPYIFTRFPLWSLSFIFPAFSPCLEKHLLFSPFC